MRKFSILILAVLLIAISFSFTSCQFDFDQFCDDVIISVVGEDNPFAEQMLSFEPLMLSRVYFVKFIDAVTHIKTIFTEADFDSALGIIQFIFTFVIYGVTWIVSLVCYLVATLLFLLIDLIWLTMYTVAFLFLVFLYSLDTVLIVLFGTAV